MKSFACRSSLSGATFEQLQAFVNKRMIHISCRVLLDSSSFIIFNDSKDDDDDDDGDKVLCPLCLGCFVAEKLNLMQFT